MKRLIFDNKYFVDIDSYNYTLKKDLKKKLDKEGEEVETFTVIGYYVNLDTLFKKLLNVKIIDSLKDGESTIKDFIESYKVAGKEIKKLLQMFKI